MIRTVYKKHCHDIKTVKCARDVEWPLGFLIWKLSEVLSDPLAISSLRIRIAFYYINQKY